MPLHMYSLSHSSESSDSDSDCSSERSKHAPDPAFALADIHLPPFNDDDKKRVDLAVEGLTPTWTFVTDAKADPVVEYVHLLPRNAPDALLSRLEHAWGIGPGTLHVDTSVNVLPLAADMHRLLEQYQWVLVPEERIIKMLQCKMDVSFFEMINEPTYKYTLVPFNDMYDMTIHCPSTSTCSRTNSTPFGAHKYPFDTLPTIVSHVHPCFVLCRGGRIFSKRNAMLFIAGYERSDPIWRELVFQSMWTYLLWVSKPIPGDSPFYRLPSTPAKELAVRNGVSEPIGRLDHTGYSDAARQRRDYSAFHKYLTRHSGSRQQDTPRRAQKSVQAWVTSVQGQTFVDNPV